MPITTELAQTLLADLLRETAPKPRTDDELLAEIAGILGFEVDALKGKSRQRPLVTARQIAMYVFRELTDLSYPAIARLFGGRDHTTVIHAVEKIQRLMSERKQIYDQVTDLHPAAEGVSTRRRAVGTTIRAASSRHRVDTPCVTAVDNRSSSTERHVVISRLGTIGGHRGAAGAHPLRCRDDGLSTIHSTYYRYYLLPITSMWERPHCEVPMRA